jgi:hypothetical protein
MIAQALVWRSTVDVLMRDLPTPVLGARVWRRNVQSTPWGRVGWPGLPSSVGRQVEPVFTQSGGRKLERSGIRTTQKDRRTYCSAPGRESGHLNGNLDTSPTLSLAGQRFSPRAV